ncbi:MAG TPA: hypothetical protein VFQ58_06885 [Flavisolibacter sp.]|jgi:hypothetical protein|nr:hypothetical protein [Flavisolibacter sp.]
MKSASINELKQELRQYNDEKLIELCLRLSRFKKENKELLTYLLFEANDTDAFVAGIKQEVDESFSEINTSNLYYAKKSIRKILRSVNKYIRYASSKQTEAELLIYFCMKMKDSGIKFQKSAALANLYKSQLKKIIGSIAALHEDLQHDYSVQIEKLEI